jgi:hypothetical protein
MTQLCRTLAAAGVANDAIALARNVRASRPQLLAALGAATGNAAVVSEQWRATRGP